jgi:signal transduction histidine kinase
MSAAGRVRYGLSVTAAHPVPSRWSPNRMDVAIAVAASVFCITGAAVLGASGDEPDLTAVGVAVLLGQCLPLAYRRRFPVPVWAATGIASFLYGVAEWPDPLVPLGAVLGLAAVVECCSRRVAVIAWIVSATFAISSLPVSGDSDGFDVWVVVTVLVFAPVLGEQQRARAAYLVEVEANASRAVRERAREIEAAQLTERAHLARELHDVVAHHVSMIVVQAEAAASVASSSTEPAASTVPALDAIASSGRRTLNELRTLLGVLRTGPASPPPTAPQPGLDQIEQLVRDVPASAVAIELTVEGTPRPLPPTVDLSAYRIVQEGITNVIKHAGATRAEVRIRYEPRRLALSICDDGRGAMPAADPGRGLDGLRERVALLDGTFAAGRLPSGGFHLDVSLPTPA